MNKKGYKKKKKTYSLSYVICPDLERKTLKTSRLHRGYWRNGSQH